LPAAMLRILLAVGLGVAVGASPSGECAAPLAEDCGAEDAVLLQARVQEHRHESGWPDFGNVMDRVKDAAQKTVDRAGGWPNMGSVINRVKDEASETVDKVAAEALASIAGKINRTISALQGRVDNYVERVNDSAADLQEGVTSLLSKSMNVSVPGFKANPNTEKQVLDLLDKAVENLDPVLSAVDGASQAIGSIPAKLGKFVKSLNATIQRALSRCQDFQSSLTEVQSLLRPNSSSLLQREQASPEDILAKLKHAVHTAQDHLGGFSGDFKGAFGSMAESMESFAKEKFGSAPAQKVSAAFHSASQRAAGLSDKISDGYGSLLAGVSRGADIVAEARGASVRLASLHLAVIVALVVPIAFM